MSPGKPSHENTALLARLKMENAAWQALLDVLREEEKALIAGDADRLALLNTAKLTQLQTVSDHARSRLDDLQAAGHPPDHSGMAAWLAQLGQPEARACWQPLHPKGQEAHAPNP